MNHASRLAAPVSLRPRDEINWGATISFVVFHFVALAGALAVGGFARGLVLAAIFYAVRLFGVTAGFHRYFGHRAFATSRIGQFLLALLATTSTQQGVLWWASHHRAHHATSDTPRDLHSRAQRGFLWSHVGWILAKTYDDTNWSKVRDFAVYPELVWLNRLHLLPSIALAVALLAIGGPHAVVWGYFVSTCLLWHGVFSLNSFAHTSGTRRYATSDESRNNLWVALVTFGEGWHNNHHHYPRSARQGFFWWEIDVTYYVLVVLEKLGLVWDLKRPPVRVLERGRASRVGLDAARSLL